MGHANIIARRDRSPQSLNLGDCPACNFGVYYVSMPDSDGRRRTAQRKAKTVKNNPSHAAREGRDAFLPSGVSGWSLYLAEAPPTSATFMDEVADLPVQERRVHKRNL